MESWHLNEALDVLRKQLLAKHPGMTIYTIGDAEHQTTSSDHNPNAAGRVNAIDCMLGKHFNVSDAIDLTRYLQDDNRVKYMIFSRRIFYSSPRGWIDYHGVNPHTDHIHLSVNDSAYKHTRPWIIERTQRVVRYQNVTGYLPTLLHGDIDDNVRLPGHYVTRAQLMLDYLVPEKVEADGVYGDLTKAAVSKIDGTRDGGVIDEPLWRKLYNIQAHA